MADTDYPTAELDASRDEHVELIRKRASMTFDDGLVYGDAAQHGTARRDVVTMLRYWDELHAEASRLRGLVENLYLDDPCAYDHNYLCQAHFLHARPCPHEVAQKLLSGNAEANPKG